MLFIQYKPPSVYYNGQNIYSYSRLGMQLKTLKFIFVNTTSIDRHDPFTIGLFHKLDAHPLEKMDITNNFTFIIGNSQTNNPFFSVLRGEEL